MVARCDVTKCRYFPEEVPEAIVTTASTSGTSIASYAAFNPFVMFLKKMWTGQTPGTTIRLDSDSGHAVIESPLVTRPARLPVDMDLIAQESMDLWAVGTMFPSYCAYTARVTKPTIFEKIKHSITLTDDEKALADEFDIKRKYLAGILTARNADTAQFKKIYEVAREVTVAAGSNTRVGRIVNVKRGEKAVLLGIAVDRDAVSAAFGGPGANDTYFTLNRDVIDSAHISLDCLAMPSLDYEIPCYIPALDRHEIIIESTTGITSLPVRYRYGVANLTLMEKIRWGQEAILTADEKKTADEFDLFDSVKAGVL
jgi:hypothetical protein